MITEDQEAQIKLLYNAAVAQGRFAPYSESFYEDVEEGTNGQERAQKVRVTLGLDRESRKCLESRWSCCWSMKWTTDSEFPSRRQCILFQWCVLSFLKSSYRIKMLTC